MALSWQLIRMTEVSILNEKGAESMGKPMGTYLTMEDPGLSETEDAYCEAAAGELGRQLASLSGKTVLQPWPDFRFW